MDLGKVLILCFGRREGYELETGEILLEGNSLNEMSADERARGGLFLAFQYPVELPGVGGMSFPLEKLLTQEENP